MFVAFGTLLPFFLTKKAKKKIEGAVLKEYTYPIDRRLAPYRYSNLYRRGETQRTLRRPLLALLILNYRLFSRLRYALFSPNFIFPVLLEKATIGCTEGNSIGRSEEGEGKGEEMRTENTWLPQNLRAEISKMHSLSSCHMIARWSGRICSIFETHFPVLSYEFASHGKMKNLGRKRETMALSANR